MEDFGFTARVARGNCFRRKAYGGCLRHPVPYPKAPVTEGVQGPKYYNILRVWARKPCFWCPYPPGSEWGDELGLGSWVFCLECKVSISEVNPSTALALKYQWCQLLGGGLSQSIRFGIGFQPQRGVSGQQMFVTKTSALL